MNKLHFLWISPLAVCFSPIGAMITYSLTDSHLSWILIIIGIMACACGEANEQ